jgi:hypothetical protein
VSAIRVRIAVLVWVAVALPCGAQNLSVLLQPGASIPLAPRGPAGEPLYTVGGGASLVGDLALPFARALHLRAMVGYDALPTPAKDVMSLVTGGLGLGLVLTPAPVLSIDISATGGYGLGIYRGNPGGSGYLSGALAFLFNLQPTFSLGIGASYRHYIPFYQGIGVFVGTSFRLGAGRKRPNVQIEAVALRPVFPVFYKYYDDHPVGTVTVRNKENRAIQDVRVSYYVKQFMDSPKQSEPIREMKKDEQRAVDLLGLFADSILRITEGTKVAADITVQYVLAGEDRSVTVTATQEVYYRNAMTWDDNRRAASFVTAKDPMVLKYAKSVAGLVRELGGGAVNLFFRQGMGMFESLRPYGMRYTIDPKSSYIDKSEDRQALDYLLFPVQTLGYKAGDCDDLSILYASLLESVGIGAAFITIPGHIFVAFSLDMPPREARKLFVRPEDLILTEDNSWVPVEVTMIQEGFLRAWQEGAREWREATGTRSAGFYSMREAWSVYPPTGMIAEDTTVLVPDPEVISEAYRQALGTFVDREIQGRAQPILDEIAKSGANPRSSNKLGVLYAQFGQYDKAEPELQKAAYTGYAPALVNLGNIAFLRKDMAGAAVYYGRALERSPEDTGALLGLAKVSYETENYGTVRDYYRRVEQKAPELAAKFAYLVSKGEQTGRAFDVMMRDAVSWNEEE